MPQIPESIRSFIGNAFDEDLLTLIEHGRPDKTADDFVNDLVFVDDMIRRVANALGEKGLERFDNVSQPTPQQLTMLAAWIKEVSPRGIAAYKAYLLDFESCGPWAAKTKQRTTEIIRQYYPEGYAAIFGEELAG